MDDSVMRAMARWPDVPSVYGWLALDRRGRWLLRGESVSNKAAIAFIARNYGHDEQGRWFFQNGPQRVFVALESTPWVLRLLDDGTLVTHTGVDARGARAAFMDEHGDVVLETEIGAGLLDDRDLELFSARLRDADGEPLSEDAQIEAVDAMSEGKAIELEALLHGTSLPLRFLAREQVPARLGFVRDPQPHEGGG